MPHSPPTVAPLQSVSSPAATASPIAAPKSSRCEYSAHTTSARLFSVCTGGHVLVARADLRAAVTSCARLAPRRTACAAPDSGGISASACVSASVGGVLGERGAERRDEHRAIDAVAAMRQRRISPREFGRERRSTRVHPAINVGANLRPNPVVVRIVGAGREIEAGLRAVREAFVRAIEQYPIRGALRGERCAGRQQRQPRARDIGGREPVP